MERKSYCVRCGSEIPAGSQFCENCGAAVRVQQQAGQQIQERKVSLLWWVLPVILAIIGGVIAYVVTRKRYGRAWLFLVVGAIVTVVGYLLYLA